MNTVVEQLAQLNDQLMNVDNERTGRNIAQNFADQWGITYDQLQSLLSDTVAKFSDDYIEKQLLAFRQKITRV